MPNLIPRNRFSVDDKFGKTFALVMSDSSSIYQEKVNTTQQRRFILFITIVMIRIKVMGWQHI